MVKLSAHSTYDEKELRLRLQTGDEAAFTQIVHHYYPRILPFIFKITKTQHTAEEILQEVFLRLWEKREDMDRIEFLRSWLFRVASNLALSWLKRAALEGRIIRQLQHGASDGHSSVEEWLDFRESNKQLQEAILQLPEQQRIIFRLRREEGLTNEEIAQRLGLSSNTVKNHLARAVQNLRKSIGDRNLVLLALYILYRF